MVNRKHQITLYIVFEIYDQMWVLFYLYINFKFNGIGHLNSLNNSWDIAISVCWRRRPSHHDIKYMNSQKSHLTEIFLKFLYLLKLNLKSPMVKCPNKVKINVLYYVLYCKKGDFLYFFEQKKILNKKTFVPKSQGTQNMHNFWHMTIFPKAHGT